MFRKREFLVLMAVTVLAFALGCAGTQMKPDDAAATGERHDLIYTCACGPDCNCGMVSTKPGKCKCGKDMVAGHVLKVEGSEALVCTCGDKCTCKLDPNDPTKCGCGKPVKRVDLKGSGLYFCNCGGACMCNYVSDMPGECRCGMPLKKVD